MACSVIVGYQANALRYGNKAMGASFAAVTGSTLDLNDLTVTGYDKADGCEGKVSLQLLDAAGMGGMTYFWYDLTDGSDVLYGWFDGNDKLVTDGDVTFATGEGLWVNAPSSDYNLQSAGQVPTSGISVTLRSGNKLAVNNTPVTIDLNDVSVSGYDEDEGCEGKVSLQILDETGMGGMTYFWYDLTDGSDVLFGWYDGNDKLVGDKEVLVGAGEGLWVYAPSTLYSIVFPGVAL